MCSSSGGWTTVEVDALQDEEAAPPRLAYCSLAFAAVSETADGAGGGGRVFLSGGMDENQELLHDVFVFELGVGVIRGRWRRLRSPVFQVCVCMQRCTW